MYSSPIHLLTRSHDSISCYLSDLSLTSASHEVLSQIGIQLVEFSSDSGHLIANEIAYQILRTPSSNRFPKPERRLWPAKTTVWNTIHCGVVVCLFVCLFNFASPLTYPTNADDILYIRPSAENNNTLPILRFLRHQCQYLPVC